MIGQCASPPPEVGLVRSLLFTVDCNIREGVQGGYNAFFGPGSALAAVLTVLLTLYVAVLGFRLLTGRTDLRVADLPMIALKLGAIVVLTTSWATYQTLVFGVLFDAPAGFANELLASVPMQQSVGAGATDIWARLQLTFDTLTESASALAITSDDGSSGAVGMGVAGGQITLQPTPGTDPAALQNITPVIQMRSALQGGPAFGATALWLSAVTLLVSTLGIIILAKLMLGLLLALGPLFVGMLLFDTTKGFFEGWLRTALGFALVPLATIVFLAALLASLEPSLAGLATARAEERYDIEPVLTILVIVLTFTAVFISVMGMCTRLVAGFRLPDFQPRLPDPMPATAGGGSGLPYADGAGQPVLGRAERLAASLAPEGAPDRRPERLAGSAALAAASAAASGGSGGGAGLDRRTDVTATVSLAQGPDAGDGSLRLGQMGRRRSSVVRRQTLPGQPAGASLSPTGSFR